MASRLTHDLSASAFNLKPVFQDTLNFLRQVRQLKPRETPQNIKDFNPYNVQELSKKLETELSSEEYNQIIHELMHVNEDNSTASLLAAFRRTEQQVSTKRKDIASLPIGVAKGYRKTSSCQAFVTAGTGRFIVDGIPLEQRFSLRQVVKLLPVFQTAGFRRFDIWCKLGEAQGPSGAMGSILMAVSNAICVVDPSLQDGLAEFCRRDPRKKERKKPGQPKARKKFTWVKR